MHKFLMMTLGLVSLAPVALADTLPPTVVCGSTPACDVDHCGTVCATGKPCTKQCLANDTRAQSFVDFSYELADNPGRVIPYKSHFSTQSDSFDPTYLNYRNIDNDAVFHANAFDPKKPTKVVQCTVDQADHSLQLEYTEFFPRGGIAAPLLGSWIGGGIGLNVIDFNGPGSYNASLSLSPNVSWLGSLAHPNPGVSLSDEDAAEYVVFLNPPSDGSDNYCKVEITADADGAGVNGIFVCNDVSNQQDVSLVGSANVSGSFRCGGTALSVVPDPDGMSQRALFYNSTDVPHLPAGLPQ